MGGGAGKGVVPCVCECLFECMKAGHPHMPQHPHARARAPRGRHPSAGQPPPHSPPHL